MAYLNVLVDEGSLFISTLSVIQYPQRKPDFRTGSQRLLTCSTYKQAENSNAHRPNQQSFKTNKKHPPSSSAFLAANNSKTHNKAARRRENYPYSRRRQTAILTAMGKSKEERKKKIDRNDNNGDGEGRAVPRTDIQKNAYTKSSQHGVPRPQDVGRRERASPQERIDRTRSAIHTPTQVRGAWEKNQRCEKNVGSKKGKRGKECQKGREVKLEKKGNGEWRTS